MDVNARITVASPEFNGEGRREAGPAVRRASASISQRGDMGAVAPAHQDAILRVA